MSQPLSDYFALESGEYLEQLDSALTLSGAPDLPGIARLARGVRGSARVAGEARIAEAAEPLESVARRLQEGGLTWSEEIRARAIRTVDDLKVLVRSRQSWGDSEEKRVQDVIDRWSDLREDAGAGAPAVHLDRLLPFLRQEVAEIVGELERCRARLEVDPEQRDCLQSVSRRMRPLRGLTGVDPLAPVLEVLEGVDDAIQRIVSQGLTAGEAHLSFFTAAGGALRGMVRELDSGVDAVNAAELEAFRAAEERLSDSAAGDVEEDALPIAALFHEDEGPHVISSPLAPSSEAGAAGEVERFLRLEATSFLDRAEALLGGAAGVPKRFDRVRAQLGRLARSVGELAATFRVTGVSTVAGEVAAALASAASAEQARDALARLRSALPGGSGAGAGAPEAPLPSTGEPVPVEALLLRGEAALREALALRETIEQLAAESGSDQLGDRLGELFDLLSLGFESPVPA